MNSRSVLNFRALEKNLNRQKKKKVEQRRTEWNGVKERDKDQKKKNRNKEKKQSKNVSLYTGKYIFLIKASFP